MRRWVTPATPAVPGGVKTFAGRSPGPFGAVPTTPYTPVRAGTTGSGSSVRPVGPVWISVPMEGQTPQS
jgi:hypothetical protein